jgi:hypothetical protein
MRNELMNDTERDLLSAVLDTLLPPNGSLPGAGVLGLGTQVEAEATLIPANGEVLRGVLAALPPDFLHRDADEREAMLQALEAQNTARFFTLIMMAYNAYYTDVRVLKALEARTGYAARPPQPQGYDLKPFDERILEKQRQRDPFWKKV